MSVSSHCPLGLSPVRGDGNLATPRTSALQRSRAVLGESSLWLPTRAINSTCYRAAAAAVDAIVSELQLVLVLMLQTTADQDRGGLGGCKRIKKTIELFVQQ